MCLCGYDNLGYLIVYPIFRRQKRDAFKKIMSNAERRLKNEEVEIRGKYECPIITNESRLPAAGRVLGTSYKSSSPTQQRKQPFIHVVISGS